MIRPQLILLFICFFMALVGCKTTPTAPSPKKLKQEGYIVDQHGQVSHLEKMERFFADYQNERPSSIKLVRYTIEGDPIFYTLKYNGTNITLIENTTKDKFAVTKSTTSNTCSGIVRQEEEGTTVYMLKNCKENSANNGIIEILTVKED